jgi:hypothetical protein
LTERSESFPSIPFIPFVPLSLFRITPCTNAYGIGRKIGRKKRYGVALATPLASSSLANCKGKRKEEPLRWGKTNQPAPIHAPRLARSSPLRARNPSPKARDARTFQQIIGVRSRHDLISHAPAVPNTIRARRLDTKRRRFPPTEAGIASPFPLQRAYYARGKQRS